MPAGSAPRPGGLASLLAAYRRAPGVADELFGPGGAMRPVWRPMIDHLARLDRATTDAHIARGINHLRDAGVYFRQYSATPAPEREWPLNPVPVLIHEAEWSVLCAGLAQRADLLEQVMADLYGPNRLVAEGHLPADLIARSPGWLRPLVGVRPASGHFLHLVSFEISRNPDGSWFVLGDRVQAPSGAGFALENRIATTRIFAELYRRMPVHRLAGFFRSFRDAMDGLPGTGEHRSAILTPGPGNASYFEHTYIARYLGLLLLEGEDMIVQDGRVMVRTVEGPQPLGAIWRRLDSEFADPLELREDSRLGTPGLVNALRQGTVSMINALGAGVLEMRAMMAFLPRISQVLTGEPLRLPNIATWWCGQPAERAYVRAHAERMVLAGAMDRDLPLDSGAPPVAADAARLEAEGGTLVGQELVTLSTAPAWRDGRLVPRPMSVRVTAARTPAGWVFMPGGYARFGADGDSTALAMQRGGAVADVWVVSDRPVAAETLLSGGGLHRIAPEPLPSRAAENLFWLGRYVERVETGIRLLRAYHLRLAETDDPEDPRLVLLAAHMRSIAIDPDITIPPGLVASLDAARACAGTVRDRFSTDGWSALQDLAKTVSQMTATATPGDDAARAMGVLLRKITGFTGLVHENMYRFPGWRFLALGRALERADAMAMALSVLTADDAPTGAAEIAVELGDSTMTHRRRYRGEATRETVLDLLVRDALNPRSIRFQLDEMLTLAADLPRGGQGGQDARPAAVAAPLAPARAQLAAAGVGEPGPAQLRVLRADLARVSDILSAAYLR